MGCVGPVTTHQVGLRLIVSISHPSLHVVRRMDTVDGTVMMFMRPLLEMQGDLQLCPHLSRLLRLQSLSSPALACSGQMASVDLSTL